jgi:tetratricopeptide (TPR) repeat protein
LIRWHVQLLFRLEREQQALASMRRTFDLLDDNRQDLYELLDWSIEHGLHAIADELAERFTAPFQRDPQLIYRLAESQLKRQQHEKAEASAERARQLYPNVSELAQHKEVAVMLQRRLLTEWAVAEFRLIADRTKPDEMLGAQVRWALADLLFDFGRPLPAAENAKSLVDAGAMNPQVFGFIDRDEKHVKGYMHYYFGMHYAETGNRDKQLEHFRQAFEHSPDNPDFLIAMFRVPNPDPAWSDDVKQKLDAASGALRKRVRDNEAKLKQPMNDNEREFFGAEVANGLNELAWLISNTQGDFQEALAASKRSLELLPEYPAYLDTLGRCYYAVGDLDNAVKVQSRAVKLMPMMYVMRRQLSQFEEALAKSRAAAKTEN